MLHRAEESERVTRSLVDRQHFRADVNTSVSPLQEQELKEEEEEEEAQTPPPPQSPRNP